VKRVPEEIHEIEKFVQLSEHAEYCDVKRLKDKVKLKLRMPRKLLTLKVESADAEGIVKKLRCEIREV
jgi:hypothetical protein